MKLTKQDYQAVLDTYLDTQENLSYRYKISFFAGTDNGGDRVSLYIEDEHYFTVFHHSWQVGDTADTFRASFAQRIAAHPELFKA